MNANPVKTAVVTGGHSYDVVNFHELFRKLEGVTAYIQHMDDFASSQEEVRAGYDVVLFYIMMQDGPSDKGLPVYAGTPKTALEGLGQTEQGILVLHHALLAYPEWPVWNEIVGIEDRGFGYHYNQSLHVEVTTTDHPITKGVSGWDMLDETYTMADAGPDSQILLTVDRENSMRTIAWTRTYGKSRVFCFQSGHDNVTWENEGFQEILKRGTLWCARRL